MPTHLEKLPELYARAFAGDQSAIDAITVDAMPLAEKAADARIATNPGAAHLRDDLVSVGYLAIVEAVREFCAKESRSGKAESYYVVSINNAMSELIAEDSSGPRPSYSEIKRQKQRDADGAQNKRGRRIVPTQEFLTDGEIEAQFITVAPDYDDGDDLPRVDDLRKLCETDREREIFDMLAAGLDERAICASAKCNFTTIQNIKRSIRTRHETQFGIGA